MFPVSATSTVHPPDTGDSLSIWYPVTVPLGAVHARSIVVPLFVAVRTVGGSANVHALVAPDATGFSPPRFVA